MYIFIPLVNFSCNDTRQVSILSLCSFRLQLASTLQAPSLNGNEPLIRSLITGFLLKKNHAGHGAARDNGFLRISKNNKAGYGYGLNEGVQTSKILWDIKYQRQVSLTPFTSSCPLLLFLSRFRSIF